MFETCGQAEWSRISKANLSSLQDLVPLIRYHHERWDGRGYPDGIRSADLPLGARILALADSLDAMCSDRPYRTTASFEEVKAEIQRCSGKQFDPAVVAAFNALAAEKGPEYFANSPGKSTRARKIVRKMLPQCAPPCSVAISSAPR